MSWSFDFIASFQELGVWLLLICHIALTCRVDFNLMARLDLLYIGRHAAGLLQKDYREVSTTRLSEVLSRRHRTRRVNGSSSHAV